MEDATVGFLIVKAVWEGDEIVDSEIRHANKKLIERAGYPKDGIVGVRYGERFPGAEDTLQAHLNALRKGESWAGRISYRDVFTSGYFDVQVLPWGLDHEHAISFSWNISEEVAAMQKVVDSAQLVMETMEALFKAK